MAAIKLKNYHLFASSLAELKPLSEQTTKTVEAKHRDMSVYAGILLREFKALVEALAEMNENELQAIYPEVSLVIGRLSHWFDETASDKTIEIYSDLRRAKQKAKQKAQFKRGKDSAKTKILAEQINPAVAIKANRFRKAIEITGYLFNR